MKVLKVQKEKQVPASTHKLYEDLQSNEAAHARILAGQAKYGTSWCEVDLRSDLVEELLDIYNYTILMELRLHEQVKSVIQPSMKQQALLNTIRRIAETLIEDVERDLPEFEGPTSNDWLKEDAILNAVS